EGYRDAKRKTRFYNIVKGTEFAEDAYGNKFYLDTDHFIKQKPPESEFHFAIMYLEKIYGVWENWNRGEYYVSNKQEGINQNNKFYMDTDHFIKQKPPESEFHFAIMYLEKIYGVWVNGNRGEYYVSNKTGGLNQNNTIALTLEDNSPNNINIRRVRNMPFMQS